MSAKQEFKFISLSHPFGLIGIFLVSFAVRIAAIDVPINVDELKWLQRGLSFVGALVDRDLAGTYLQHHPGVTTMWVNGTGAMIHCVLRDWFPSDLNLDKTSLQACAQTLKANIFPVETYIIVRWFQGIVTSACTVYLYVLARQLLSNPIALIGTGLLVFEPFFLAYQRFLTTDAFQVDFTAIALFLLLLYLRGDGKRRLLFASGASMGLAVASKSPALTVLPAIVTWIVLIELGVWRSSFPRRGFLRQGFDLGLWAIALVATIVAIWPALWVAPIQTAMKVLGDLQAETERGEFFFLGQVTDAPGAIFYPLVLLYRLSPLLLLGLIALIIALIAPKLRCNLRCVPELMALALVALFVAFILSSSDNKIDRYIIPIIPALAFLAAAGWEQVYRWLECWPGASKAALGLLALGQLAIFVPYYPYYVTYYNPLLGGAPAAERLLMLGNGEGLDRAARWLERAPDAEEMTVATWYAPSFAPYFKGESKDIGKALDPKQPWWQEAHRVVLYVNQFQRQLPSPEVLAYFNAQKPLYTVRLNGVDYARIYPGAIALPQELEQIQGQQNPVLKDSLRLRGYNLSETQLQAGQTLGVTLYWEVFKTPTSEIRVPLAVKKGDRSLLKQESSLLSAFAPYFDWKKIAPGTIVRDFHAIALPSGLAGRYTLELEGSPNPASVTPLAEFDVVAREPD